MKRAGDDDSRRAGRRDDAHTPNDVHRVENKTEFLTAEAPEESTV